MFHASGPPRGALSDGGIVERKAQKHPAMRGGIQVPGHRGMPAGRREVAIAATDRVAIVDVRTTPSLPHELDRIHRELAGISSVATKTGALLVIRQQAGI